MSKKTTKQKEKVNPLSILFTHTDEFVADKMAYSMELAFYNFYKYNESDYVVFGIKSSIEKCSELEGDTIDPIYNEYVRGIKNNKGYGVKLDFIYETKRRETDDL